MQLISWLLITLILIACWAETRWCVMYVVRREQVCTVQVVQHLYIQVAFILAAAAAASHDLEP